MPDVDVWRRRGRLPHGGLVMDAVAELNVNLTRIGVVSAAEGDAAIEKETRSPSEWPRVRSNVVCGCKWAGTPLDGCWGCTGGRCSASCRSIRRWTKWRGGHAGRCADV